MKYKSSLNDHGFILLDLTVIFIKTWTDNVKCQAYIVNTVGFIKIATISESIIEAEGDFTATFGVNNAPIYKS